MKIIEKFIQKQSDLYKYPQPVILVAGDSVTQGCFELEERNGNLDCSTRPNCSYVDKIADIFELLYPTVNPVIINSGIGGGRARVFLSQVERDIKRFSPDLVILCFGLNDASDGEEGFPLFEENLRKIINTVKASGAECIFMTPNLRIKGSSNISSSKLLNDTAERIKKSEVEGWLDKCVESAKAICGELGAKVCDCHALWKKMYENGVDTDRLLSNRINHPIEELHGMFAYELVKTMFE